jgi:hypothetical protein
VFLADILNAKGEIILANPQTLTVHGITMIDVEYAEDRETNNTEMTLAPHGHQQGWNVEQLRAEFQTWCQQEQTTNNAQIRIIGQTVVGTFVGTTAQKLQALQPKLQAYFQEHLPTTTKARAATTSANAGKAGDPA